MERNGVLRGHESFVYDVAFSPDGEQVASSAWDGTARLWDATSGRQTGLLKHEKNIVSSVAFSRDGRRLVTVERDRGITLWDVASQKVARTWSTATGYWGADTRAALNPAGTLLACGCARGAGTALGHGRWTGDRPAQGTRRRARSTSPFTPTATCSPPPGTTTASVSGTSPARTCVAVLRGHTDSVWRVAFSGDGKLLASGSGDKTIRFWDARTGAATRGRPAGSKVYGLAFNPEQHAAGRRVRRQYGAPLRRRHPPARRRAARAYRLRSRRRLEPRRHPPGLGLRRRHGSRLGRSAAGRLCPDAGRQLIDRAGQVGPHHSLISEKGISPISNGKGDSRKRG